MCAVLSRSFHKDRPKSPALDQTFIWGGRLVVEADVTTLGVPTLVVMRTSRKA